MRPLEDGFRGGCVHRVKDGILQVLRGTNKRLWRFLVGLVCDNGDCLMRRVNGGQ